MIGTAAALTTLNLFQTWQLLEDNRFESSIPWIFVSTAITVAGGGLPEVLTSSRQTDRPFTSAAFIRISTTTATAGSIRSATTCTIMADHQVSTIRSAGPIMASAASFWAESMSSR